MPIITCGGSNPPCPGKLILSRFAGSLIMKKADSPGRLILTPALDSPCNDGPAPAVAWPDRNYQAPFDEGIRLHCNLSSCIFSINDTHKLKADVLTNKRFIALEIPVRNGNSLRG